MNAAAISVTIEELLHCPLPVGVRMDLACFEELRTADAWIDSLNRARRLLMLERRSIPGTPEFLGRAVSRRPSVQLSPMGSGRCPAGGGEAGEE